jgi:hypothetical protein
LIDRWEADATGVIAGAIGSFALARLAGTYFSDIRMPDTVPW